MQLSGSMSHIFGPRNETPSLPRYTDFTSGIENFRNLSQIIPAVVLLRENMIHNSGNWFLLSRNISIARD